MPKTDSRYATADEVTKEMQQLIDLRHRHACATCVFFEPSDDMVVEFYDITDPPAASFVMHGLCRRHAPRPVLDLEDDGRGAWPIVDFKQDWCGEHRRAGDPIELADRFTHKPKVKQ